MLNFHYLFYHPSHNKSPVFPHYFLKYLRINSLNNYNNQKQIALQNKIFSMNEINESGIEPVPMDNMDDFDFKGLSNRNMAINNGIPVPNRRVKGAGNCECCSIM